MLFAKAFEKIIEGIKDRVNKNLSCLLRFFPFHFKYYDNLRTSLKTDYNLFQILQQVCNQKFS